MLYWFLTHLNLVERVITWRGWQKITDQALGKPGLDSFFFFFKSIKVCTRRGTRLNFMIKSRFSIAFQSSYFEGELGPP